MPYEPQRAGDEGWPVSLAPARRVRVPRTSPESIERRQRAGAVRLDWWWREPQSQTYTLGRYDAPWSVMLALPRWIRRGMLAERRARRRGGDSRG